MNILAGLLPPQASELARETDRTWNLMLSVTGFFFVVVVGVMTFFVIRYRRRAVDDRTPEITHNTTLEIVWTGIPLILVIYFFYLGFKGFMNYDTPSAESQVISVRAQKWQFTFFYPNGAQDRDLYLLKGQAVRLDMTSDDVLHALYIPAFRTQRNLIPNRITTIWFIPTEYSPRDGWPAYCTQYCGDGHSRMFSRVHVLDPVKYEEKMQELANPFKSKGGGAQRWVPYAELGRTLYSQLGCNACHSVPPSSADGTGPTWSGLWKRDHEFSYSDPPGYTLLATDSDEKWEQYLTDSMIEPDKTLVRFNNRNYSGMTSYTAQLSGSEVKIEKRRALIEFIKSLNPDYKPPFEPDSDVYDADKNPDIHPEFLRARQAASQTQPAQ